MTIAGGKGRGWLGLSTAVLTLTAFVHAGPVMETPEDAEGRGGETSPAWNVFITVDTNAFRQRDTASGEGPTAFGADMPPGKPPEEMDLTSVYRGSVEYRASGDDLWGPTPDLDATQRPPVFVTIVFDTNRVARKRSRPPPEAVAWDEDVERVRWWIPGAGGISMAFCLIILLVVVFKARS